MEKDLTKRMRFTASGLSVREAMEGEEESRTIAGCAIVFDAETTLYDGKYGREREVIAPSCVTREWLATQDVKLNMLHDREMTIARNNKGEGTLKLDLREDGLYFEVDVPKCDIGDRCLALVRNKTYTGCSFEFWPQDYTIEEGKTEDGREDILVTQTAFRSLEALTIAMDPAYQQTSVEAREGFEMMKREWEDLNECERRLKEREDAEREARHQLAVRENERYRKGLIARINENDNY